MIRGYDFHFSNSLVSLSDFKTFVKLISERKFAKLVFYASLRTFETMDRPIQHEIVFYHKSKNPTPSFYSEDG